MHLKKKMQLLMNCIRI